jgi:hypothetical protein
VNPSDETARRIAVPVKKRDVLPMAKKTCPTCAGVGEFRSVTAGKFLVCGCAQRRFMRKQACMVGADGRLFAVPPYEHVSAETLKDHEDAVNNVPIQSQEVGGDGVGKETTEAEGG